jgi:short subunit dehydrogenase-like uncharacterized protein
MPSNFLIYGSTGYTGRLIALEAVRQGLKPILAGRSVEKVGQQAAELGLEWRAFRLSNTVALEHALQDTGLMLLAAGPFSHTSLKVAEVCLRTGAHYLDITGEVDVYEALAKLDTQAKSAGVMLGTGMGFDVVPTDCLALYLKNRLPEAVELKLALTSRGPSRVSRGTLRSGLEQLEAGLRVRRGGKLVRVPWNEKSLVIDFGFGPRTCNLYPWGDVSTAFYSTGIPNIEDYQPVDRSFQRMLRMLEAYRRILGWKAAYRLSRSLINLMPDGASAEERQSTQAVVWGQVKDKDGHALSARLVAPEGYDFTALSTVLAVQKILASGAKPGFQTPAMAFGEEFVSEIAGVRLTPL